MPKKLKVYMALWTIQNDDPAVFVARTRALLNKQIFNAIEDGFYGTVERQPSGDAVKDIDDYFEVLEGTGEWLTYYTDTI